MTIGYITLAHNGGLLPESTLTVDGATFPVPARTEAMGNFAPKRILEAVHDAGYAPDGDYYAALGEFDGQGRTIALVAS